MTPTTTPFTFQVETFQGEPLVPPINVTGEAKRYANVDEAKASGEWPNDATVLEYLNDDALARAKSNARAKALASHMEAYQASDAFKISQAIKSLLALGFSRADAEALAQKQSK